MTPHLAYIATLPCEILMSAKQAINDKVQGNVVKFVANLSLMASFADINVSQGSVETYARCGGIFDTHLCANLPRNLPVKIFFKSVKN